MQAMQSELAGKPGDKPGADAAEIASLIAELAKALQKHRWIAYVGLALILYVALNLERKAGTR
jgi:hypothetical protein